jgi:hypothetical protein
MLPLTWTTHFPATATVAPFLHFDLGSAIAFQGTPVGGAGVFAEAGTRTVGCEFEIPPDAYGKSFGVLAGLWDPERLAQPDERLHPDSGEQDRRVVLGTLTVAPDGTATLTPTGAAGRGR